MEKSENTLRILANLSLSDRIARGNYDGVNCNVENEEFFSTYVPADYSGEYKLFHFDRRNIRYKEAIIGEIRREGFKPGNLAELLAFGEVYPKEQLKYPIIAFGSILRFANDFSDVPMLCSRAAERGLTLRSCEIGWEPYHRFLGFRRYSLYSFAGGRGQ